MEKVGHINPVVTTEDENKSVNGRELVKKNCGTDVKLHVNNDVDMLMGSSIASNEIANIPVQNENNTIVKIRRKIHELSQSWILQRVVLPFLGHLLVFTYVLLAVAYWFRQNKQPPLVPYDGLGLLLTVTLISYWGLFYYRFLKPFYFENYTHSNETDVCIFVPNSLRLVSKFVYFIPLVIFLVIVVMDSWQSPTRLRSLSCISLILLLGYIFSKHPSEVRWSIIFRGLTLQIIMAMCTIRWEAGRTFFQDFGHKIEQFLSFSYVGAAFVYSDNLVYKHAVFAFQSLSVIFFVNFLVEVLFYCNVLQKVFKTLGWFLQKAIGTTAVESINCCVSVFLGMSEAMLVIKPYIGDLTKSELQAVLLGQLSTVAGSVFAAYASFGVNPGYLVTASVMSAPAALSLSKLVYPETEISRTTAESFGQENEHKKKYRGPLSAGCDGAVSAVQIVMSIVATLIAFISLVACANAIVAWFAQLIGYEGVTLVFIFGKLLTPVAYLLGIDASQCHYVGELIATKMMINEFVAYQRLGELKKLKLLSVRSEAIATYALCSFSNPGSVAGSLAMVSSLCPKQLDLATELAFRAYIGGIVTCFMTASIAGLFIPGDELPQVMPHDVFNATMTLLNSTI